MFSFWENAGFGGIAAINKNTEVIAAVVDDTCKPLILIFTSVKRNSV